MDEIWKDVVGYESWYSVSSFGRIRQDRNRNGTYKGRIISTRIYKKSRYARVILAVHPLKKSFSVHRIVARAFIGECPKGFTVNHKDTNKSNNFASNLEYLTIKDNILHSHKHGISARGERVNLAKLTEEQVLEIRDKFKNKIKCTTLQKEYKIAETTVYNIIHRRTWKHI